MAKLTTLIPRLVHAMRVGWTLMVADIISRKLRESRQQAGPISKASTIISSPTLQH